MVRVKHFSQTQKILTMFLSFRGVATLRPKQNVQRVVEDIFKCILNQKLYKLIRNSLEYFPEISLDRK